MDIRLALIAGKDIPIPSLQLTVHQPKVEEIALIGEEDFFSGAHSFCINKKLAIDNKELLDQITNFDIFMMIMREKETADKKFAVTQLATLLFQNEKMSFTPKTLLFSGGGNIKSVDRDNFEELQQVVQEVCCLRSSAMTQQTFNPIDDKSTEIAKKLMRARERVAAQKAQSGETGSLLSNYVSVLTVGLHYPLDKVLSLTLYQLFDLVERYSLYLDWDLSIRSRLAGGKSDKEIENWMKNIHN